MGVLTPYTKYDMTSFINSKGAVEFKFVLSTVPVIQYDYINYTMF